MQRVWRWQRRLVEIFFIGHRKNERQSCCCCCSCWWKNFFIRWAITNENSIVRERNSTMLMIFNVSSFTDGNGMCWREIALDWWWYRLRGKRRRRSKQHYPTEIDLGDKETTKLGCYLPLAMLLFHTNTSIYNRIQQRKRKTPSRAHHRPKENTKEQDDKEWFALLLMILSKIIMVNPQELEESCVLLVMRSITLISPKASRAGDGACHQE